MLLLLLLLLSILVLVRCRQPLHPLRLILLQDPEVHLYLVILLLIISDLLHLVGLIALPKATDN